MMLRMLGRVAREFNTLLSTQLYLDKVFMVSTPALLVVRDELRMCQVDSAMDMEIIGVVFRPHQRPPPYSMHALIHT